MAIVRTPRSGSGTKKNNPLTGSIGNMIGQALRPGTQTATTLNAGRVAGTTSGSSSGSGSSGGYTSSGSGGYRSGSGGSSGGGRSSSGGGGGGGVGATSSTATTAGPVATDGSSEWLQAAMDIFSRDPQAMLAVQMQDQYGDSGGNALYGMLTPYADAANALYLMQRGTDASSGTVDDNLQWLDDYWSALQTPGARIDTATAIGNLFNAGADSPLHAYLNTGDPSQQANRALQLIAGGVETGMSPIMASAIMDRLRLERDRYLGEAARGGATGSYIDYLNSTGVDVGQLMGVR